MSTEHVDVLIVGAGLSGIGAARHLQLKCPGKTFALLEARDRSGGTWDLFRYPGIRSDSDMYTLGYSFKPWGSSKAIADGDSILRYIRDTAAEFSIDEHIRFNRRAVHASFSTEDATWTVEVQRTDSGETEHISCNFVMACSGYYDYQSPYTPEFPGVERFQGQLVHPQFWDEDLDYEGKRVLVIGSGATAITLVPSLAQKAAHVTMLQRSPTYVVSLPEEDKIANALRKSLPASTAYTLARWKNVLRLMLSYQASRRLPKAMKALVRKGAEMQLPRGYDIDKHFTPKYDPWDQRLCVVPDGDLFRAICNGTASVETDRIETFTETGVKLQSGRELEADIVVTATGLSLLVMGGIQLDIDGDPVDVPSTLGYKGMMFSGVPNLAMILGYTNASWTLKCDLACEYVCRLINHMDQRGYQQCVARNNDPSVREEPFIDLSAGYVLRALDQLPKQGSKAPWKLYQNYALDIVSLRRGSLEDSSMEFSRARRKPQPAEPVDRVAV